MKIHLALALMLGSVSAPVLAAPAAVPAASADAAFVALYTEEWNWRKGISATNEDSGSVPISAHLPDVSAKAQAGRLSYWQDIERRLDAINPKTLSAENQVDYAVYAVQLDALIAAQQFHEFERPLNSTAPSGATCSIRRSSRSTPRPTTAITCRN